MKVVEIMTSNVESLKPTQSIRVAARKMRQFNIGFIPIVTDKGKIVGVITDRDISCHIVAIGRDPNSTDIQKCMSTDIISCYEDQQCSIAAQLMEEHNVQRLIVFDRNDILVGIISVDDLAFFSSDIAGRVLETINVTHRNGGVK